LLSSQIPTIWVHSSEIFKIQQNETVRMTNVPNTIGVPTHEVDLWHHEFQIGERTPKSPMEPPQGEERKRKKERGGQCPILHRSHARQVGMTASWVTPEHMALLDWRGTVPASMAHRARAILQCTWCDSFINRADQTSVTPNGHILKISFGRIYFSKYDLKKAKIQKKSLHCEWKMWVAHGLKTAQNRPIFVKTF
jgi:hypothetical protein